MYNNNSILVIILKKINLANVIYGALIIAILCSCSDTELATVDTVTVNPPNPSVAQGSQFPFFALVIGTNNPEQTVTWVVTGNDKAGTTINTNGLLSIAVDETATTLTVRATSTFDTSKSGTSTVSVLIPTVTSVIVSPQSPNVALGQQRQFSATVTGTNYPAYTVTWAVTGNGKPGTTINTNGLLSIAVDETATTLTVTATSTFDTSKSGTSTVNVIVPTITNVTVSPQNQGVAQGQQRQFTASVIGTNSPVQTVTWAVTGNGKPGTTISTSGLLSIAVDETATTLTITATSTFDASKSGTSTVNVLIPTITSVTVSPQSPDVAQGQQRQFTASVIGTNYPVQTVTWAVTGNSKSGTTISANGLLSIAADETATTLTVRATSTFDISKSGTSTVNVLVPTVTSVTVSPQNPSVAKGYQHQFTSSVIGTNSPVQTVTWAVTGNGKPGTTISTSGLLSIAADETATTLTVRATSTFDISKSGTSTVSVTAPDVELYVNTSITPVDLSQSTGTTAFDRVLNYIKNNAANDTTYTIILNQNISYNNIVFDSTSVNNKTGVIIIFKGRDSERILTLNRLYIRNFVELILEENITLKPTNTPNTSELVTLETWDPIFRMRNGSKITENRHSNSSGNPGAGAVFISNGTFFMEGGEISSNFFAGSQTSAGAVYISTSGKFIMSGGVIKNNTGSANMMSAGGVFINSGSFTKTGGIIYGNDAEQDLANKANNASYTGAAIYWGSNARKVNNTLGEADNLSTSDSSNPIWVSGSL
jgi:hypothetical protein